MNYLKSFLLICLVLIGVGCNLEIDDGEKLYTLTTTSDELDAEDTLDEVGAEEVYEEMNFDLIKVEFNFVINSVRVIKVDRHGMTMDEIGEFIIIDNLVYVPVDVEMKGFYQFELFDEENNLTHTVVSPGNTMKKKHHPELISSQYVLNEREAHLSNEVMRLVYEMGYPLGASYKFALKHLKFEDGHIHDDEFIFNEMESGNYDEADDQNDDQMGPELYDDMEFADTSEDDLLYDTI